MAIAVWIWRFRDYFEKKNDLERGPLKISHVPTKMEYRRVWMYLNVDKQVGLMLSAILVADQSMNVHERDVGNLFLNTSSKTA